MSPFGIFAIVLIALYIMYYAVLISRDIYSKKNVAKSEEEEFDISSLHEEESTVDVEESENGFTLNSSRDEIKATTHVPSEASDGAATFVPNPSPDVQRTSNPTEPASSSGGGESAVRKKIDKAQEEMDEIDPIGSQTMSTEFFRDLLLEANMEGSLFVKKTHVPAV